jgi:hypothetical protein
MDLQRIKSILEKYYSGESTLEEEKFLKEYFGQMDLTDNNMADKEILGFFNSGKATMPAGYLEELNNYVENKWITEIRNKYYSVIKWASSIAAILILSVGIIIFNNKEKPAVMADTYTNPEAAYLKTKQVLVFISKTMNSNTHGLKYLSDADKSLKTCNKLSKINETFNSIKNENNKAGTN